MSKMWGGSVKATKKVIKKDKDIKKINKNYFDKYGRK